MTFKESWRHLYGITGIWSKKTDRRRPNVPTHDVAGLAVRLLLHGIERLSSELDVADHAGEAIHVEDLVHGGASRPFSNDVFPTAGTAAWKIRGYLLQRNS